MAMTKAERAKELRYKRPALASMGYEAITAELWEIQEACTDVHWFIGQGDDTLLNALEGDEDAEWEFRMAFSDLDGRAEQLLAALSEFVVQDTYDDCTVALIGNRYNQVGYDGIEEDYFSLCGYEQELATTEAGKRLMRHSKAEMVSTIGQCVGVLVAFLDLRQQYDYLKATMDILRNENTSMLRQVKEIDAAYEAAAEDNFRPWGQATKNYDLMLTNLPDRLWLE